MHQWLLVELHCGFSEASFAIRRLFDLWLSRWLLGAPAFRAGYINCCAAWLLAALTLIFFFPHMQPIVPEKQFPTMYNSGFKSYPPSS
jgi:hypothetical protein